MPAAPVGNGYRGGCVPPTLPMARRSSKGGGMRSCACSRAAFRHASSSCAQTSATTSSTTASMQRSPSCRRASRRIFRSRFFLFLSACRASFFCCSTCRRSSTRCCASMRFTSLVNIRRSILSVISSIISIRMSAATSLVTRRAMPGSERSIFCRCSRCVSPGDFTGAESELFLGFSAVDVVRNVPLDPDVDLEEATALSLGVGNDPVAVLVALVEDMLSSILRFFLRGWDTPWEDFFFPAAGNCGLVSPDGCLVGVARESPPPCLFSAAEEWALTFPRDWATRSTSLRRLAMARCSTLASRRRRADSSRHFSIPGTGSMKTLT
mmetsp:Transcript_32060/g.89758  ORF Transcript_32060/g.89758 Transcript_32060/m.89758 type:complete len:324 (+) Transcript_32060:434-1405(+)